MPVIRALCLLVACSVAPWSEESPPEVPASPSPSVHRPAPARSVRPPVAPRPRPSPSARPPEPKHPRLAALQKREQSIWKALGTQKSPVGFFELGVVRFQIATEMRRLKLVDDARFRRYLLKKAIGPLKLNLRRWGSRAKDQSGTPYDQRSWQLISKIMRAVKETVHNSRSRKSGKIHRGRATHYGGEKIYGNEPYPEAHAQPTAVGDTYCMFGQTAAFNRAPLNTWIRVTNTRNTRFVDLRVNDTGGFEPKGVLIDLSRGAYNVLAMRSSDKVTVRSIPASEAIPEPTLCSGRGAQARQKNHLADTHFTAPESWR